jgi:hypothetical protein
MPLFGRMQKYQPTDALKMLFLSHHIMGVIIVRNRKKGKVGPLLSGL